MSEWADVVAAARELVARRGRIEHADGDCSVDTQWHMAAKLLPVIDVLVAERDAARARIEELEAALRATPRSATP